MTKILPLLALLFALVPFTAHAEDTDAVTAIIDIDNHTISITVDDLASCKNAIANRINSLKAIYQNNFTVSTVIGQCYDRSGQLLASGACGVKIGSGQLTRLCVPQMQ